MASSSTILYAQDVVFSQFYNAPIQLNPGLVGLSTQAQVHINYRNQWPAWPQVYETYAASYDCLLYTSPSPRDS